jgi:hypothetical protein
MTKFTVIRHQSGRYTYATKSMNMSLKEARDLASEVGGISVAASLVADLLVVLNQGDL